MLKGIRSKGIPAATVEVFQREGIDFRTWLWYNIEQIYELTVEGRL